MKIDKGLVMKVGFLALTGLVSIVEGAIQKNTIREIVKEELNKETEGEA